MNKPKNSLCLQDIQKSTNNQELLQTRSRIAEGVEIIVDEQRKIVIINNFSDSSLYWTCPGLISSFKTFKTYRIRPRKSSIVYNYNLVKLNETVHRKMPGFHESHIVNVSFNKYWGETSNRNSIEKCPCWFNISFNELFFG